MANSSDEPEHSASWFTRWAGKVQVRCGPHRGDSAFNDFIRTHSRSPCGTAFLLTGTSAAGADLLHDTLVGRYPNWCAEAVFQSADGACREPTAPRASGPDRPEPTAARPGRSRGRPGSRALQRHDGVGHMPDPACLVVIDHYGGEAGDRRPISLAADGRVSRQGTIETMDALSR